jgi:RNA polymerase sigma-70 factor, ECF subfamily
MSEQIHAGLRSETARPDGAGTPWPALIQRIQSNDAAAMEELYRVFSRGVRFYLWRQLGREDLEDTVHDTFLIVAQAIRRGDLREPDRLMGFVWTIVRRQLATQIERTVDVRKRCVEFDGTLGLLDHCPDPEWAAIVRQRQSLARKLLGELPERDREVLVRFYMLEQTPAQICRDMELTETQFRLLKSRAKARFGALGRRKLAKRRICGKA